MIVGLIATLVAGFSFFASLPTTTNYQLNSYGFGSGGSGGTTTGNYALEGTTGEISNGSPSNTGTYYTKAGFIETQQANVPKLTISTPTSSTLKFVIDQQGNPSDALYAIQVCVGVDFTGSPPTCGGTTMYVKNDNTLGASLTTSDYQNYATWGGATGTTVTGLTSSTTYYFRAKATQHTFSSTGCAAGTGCGRFTESQYGPSANGTTTSGGQTISFCLYTNANCAAGGNSVAYGAVSAATVTDSPNNIGVDFATNATNGGNVYIYSANGGLRSSIRSYTISSATADLGAINIDGFGAKVTSATQTSGGPFSAVSPYNGAGNNVGVLSTSINTILSSSASLVGGNASIQLKLRVSYGAPPATDYSDTLTVVAAASF